MSNIEFMNLSKGLFLSAALFAGSLAMSCKAGVAHVINNPTNAETKVEQSIQKINEGGNGQEPECINLYGEDSIETRRAVSLYREDFNSGRYMECLPRWRYAYQNAPCFKEYITADGAYLMSVLIGQTNPKDTATIHKYADTLMEIYNTRLRLFGRKGSVVGRKGSDMLKYMPWRALEAIQLMKEAMELEGKETEAMMLYELMYGMVIQNRTTKKITDDDIIDTYDKMSVIIDYNLKGAKAKYNDPNTGDTAYYGQTLRFWEWTDNIATELVSPYLTCEKLTELYTPKFKATPNDPALVGKIITLLKRSPNCAKTEFYLEVAEQNFKLSPDAAAAAALAKAFQDKGNDSKAKTYYEQAAELETDKMQKADYYIVLGSIDLSASNCVSARNYARKALENNPKSGDAYMIIGNAYMACAAGCGDNDVARQYPYLAAYDKFVQAKSVDASVSDKANARMAIAAARFPEKEALFFLSIPEGTTVNTGCWIGENTTVRARK
jgi:hypothetical protein